jgi:hypothetical protein
LQKGVGPVLGVGGGGELVAAGDGKKEHAAGGGNPKDGEVQSAGAAGKGGCASAVAVAVASREVQAYGAGATDECAGADVCDGTDEADDWILLGGAQLVAVRRIIAKLAVPPRRWKKPRLAEPASAPEVSAALPALSPSL